MLFDRRHFFKHFTASIIASATPRLLLRDSKAPNCRENKVLKDLGPYAEWPKVADAVIKA